MVIATVLKKVVGVFVRFFVRHLSSVLRAASYSLGNLYDMGKRSVSPRGFFEYYSGSDGQQ
jgi:hypothetical protein